MDKRKSFLNVTVAISFKLIILVATIFVRRFLIRYVGNEANGLNSLYLNLFGFLNVAELGIGGAITFCMYKPIVDGNKEKVAALYQLFKKSYYTIGAIIFAMGLLMIPILPYLAKDFVAIPINLYLTFFLMLISVVMSYMFSAKTSLINAYKDNYITTSITSLGMIIQQALQMLVLVLFRSFVWYLVCRIISIVIQWIATEIITKRLHDDILSQQKRQIDSDTKKDIVKNIKALFMHRIGSILVNSADSIIISTFIGVVILGKYSNYTTIILSMTGVISLFFSPLTSIIGHMFVLDKKKLEKYYNFFFALNAIVGFIFFLGYYSVIDNLILILFGPSLEISRAITFVITVNYFIQFMRQAALLFRDATGTFYNDRWKPLFEGLANVILSVSFVFLFSKLFNEDFGIVGVVFATILTNLFICHIVEPYVLYKHAFKSSAKKHFFKNYVYIAIFIIALIFLDASLVSISTPWIELLANGGISLAYSLSISAIIFICDKDFRVYLKSYIAPAIKRKLKKS